MQICMITTILVSEAKERRLEATAAMNTHEGVGGSGLEQGQEPEREREREQEQEREQESAPSAPEQRRWHSKQANSPKPGSH